MLVAVILTTVVFYICNYFYNLKELDVSKWKTYTNNDYGYSFEYPADLKIDTMTSNLVNIEPYGSLPLKFSYSIQVDNNIGNVTGKERANGEYAYWKSAIFSPTTKVFISDATVDGINGGKVTVTAQTDIKTMEEIYIVKNDKMYDFEGTNNQTLFDKIISTFKFTK